MITEIGETIDVSAVFLGGHLRPVSFLWRSRKYKVKEVFGRYHDYLGKSKRFNFAVGTGSGDVFEICLDTATMTWELIRIHSEQ